MDILKYQLKKKVNIWGVQGKITNKKLRNFIWIIAGIILIGGMTLAITSVSDTGFITSGNITADNFFGNFNASQLQNPPWVLKSGDNMTGNLNVEGNINLPQNLTIGSCTFWHNGTLFIDDC